MTSNEHDGNSDPTANLRSYPEDQHIEQLVAQADRADAERLALESSESADTKRIATSVSERAPEVWVEDIENPTMQQLAFRVGEPSEWGRAEQNYEVGSRLCNELGLTHITDEIREIAIAESDRQHTLFGKHEQAMRKKEEDAEYRSRMGSIATGLVDVLVPEDDPRDRGELTDGVLNALRPLDERLQSVEWDGIVR